jgi:hypothetical protein
MGKSAQRGQDVVSHGRKLGESLNRRRSVTVELPEFLVRAIHARADQANEGDDAEDEVTFNDVVEWLLVSEITLRRLPHLEAAVPGFTAAMASWLMETTYRGPEDDH